MTDVFSNAFISQFLQNPLGKCTVLAVNAQSTGRQKFVSMLEGWGDLLLRRAAHEELCRCMQMVLPHFGLHSVESVGAECRYNCVLQRFVVWICHEIDTSSGWGPHSRADAARSMDYAYGPRVWTARFAQNVCRAFKVQLHTNATNEVLEWSTYLQFGSWAP